MLNRLGQMFNEAKRNLSIDLTGIQVQLNLLQTLAAVIARSKSVILHRQLNSVTGLPN